MKTIEEFIRATKDLNHLSVAFGGGEWKTAVSRANRPNGYFIAVDKDPIRSIEKAFALKETNSFPEKRRDAEDLI